jgi:hypothetical protein
MVYFQTKNPNLVKFFAGLAVEDVGIFYGHFVFFRPNGIFCGLLVHFEVIWYIYPRFGMLYHETSGNPGSHSRKRCHAKGRGERSRLEKQPG